MRQHVDDPLRHFLSCTERETVRETARGGGGERGREREGGVGRDRGRKKCVSM